jgi:hypothetical protein
MGPTGFLETSVTNYQSTLCNIPGEQGSSIIEYATKLWDPVFPFDTTEGSL